METKKTSSEEFPDFQYMLRPEKREQSLMPKGASFSELELLDVEDTELLPETRRNISQTKPENITEQKKDSMTHAYKLKDENVTDECDQNELDPIFRYSNASVGCIQDFIRVKDAEEQKEKEISLVKIKWVMLDEINDVVITNCPEVQKKEDLAESTQMITYKNINDVYKFVSRIKNGTYTTINKYYSEILKKEIVIKITPKIGVPKRRIFELLPQELEVADNKTFQHPNIVRFIETYDIGLRSYIMMEYIDSGNLTEYIQSRKRLDPYTYQRFFCQLVNAVNYCLDNGVCHRKLSTENCLITKEMDLKLCDFSYCQDIKSCYQLLNTHCGTLGYTAPEILMCRNYLPILTEAWACGVILFVMIYGAMPFDSSNFAKLLKQVQQPIKYYWYCDTPLDAIMIMRQTIAPVRRRWSLKKVFSHYWVTPPSQSKYKEYMKWHDKMLRPTQSMIRKELIDMVDEGYDIPLELIQENTIEEENNEIEQ